MFFFSFLNSEFHCLKKNLWNVFFLRRRFLKEKLYKTVGLLKGNPNTNVWGRILNPEPSVQMVNALPLCYMLSCDIPCDEYMISR